MIFNLLTGVKSKVNLVSGAAGVAATGTTGGTGAAQVVVRFARQEGWMEASRISGTVWCVTFGDGPSVTLGVGDGAGQRARAIKAVEEMLAVSREAEAEAAQQAPRDAILEEGRAGIRDGLYRDARADLAALAACGMPDA